MAFQRKRFDQERDILAVRVPEKKALKVTGEALGPVWLPLFGENPLSAQRHYDDVMPSWPSLQDLS